MTLAPVSTVTPTAGAGPAAPWRAPGGPGASTAASLSTLVTPQPVAVPPRPAGAASAEAPAPSVDAPSRSSSRPVLLGVVVLGIAVLAVVSLFVGVSDVSLGSLLADDGRAGLVMVVSRIPRTAAILLSGAALAIAGMIMQAIARNRFVEPATVGTTESAILGVLVVTVLAPAAPLMVKMGVAAVFALGGTALFLRILRSIPLRSVLVVPLVGLMLGGIIGAVTTFFAYRLDLLQSLSAWTTGDFSGVLQGRYELLWIGLVLTVVAYLAADRFTLAGMGSDVTTSLGLSYRSVVNLGLVLVSLISAVVVVTVGVVPFLGLVVPNVVSVLLGDNMRRTAPWVAALGAGFVLVCDLIGRVVRYPYEVPVGVVVGVVGSALFLYLLLRRGTRVA